LHIDAYTQEKNNGLATTDSTVDIGKKKKTTTTQKSLHKYSNLIDYWNYDLLKKYSGTILTSLQCI